MSSSSENFISQIVVKMFQEKRNFLHQEKALSILCLFKKKKQLYSKQLGVIWSWLEMGTGVINLFKES